jgi:hypothetical protein
MQNTITCPFLVLKIKNKFPLEPIATSNFGHRILETINPAALICANLKCS